MSHISLIDTEDVYKTPHPRERGQRVKDFHTAKYSEGPKTYLPCATPGARRIFATDLVAEMEEDENIEAISDFQSLMWKTYSVSPLFDYDPVTSPDQLLKYLKKHLKEVHQITVETVKGLRGNREDGDCLKICVVSKGDKSNVSSIYFTSVHAQECDIKSKHGLLPLALSNGTEDVIQAIFLKMERLFDCVINPLCLEPIDLKWMTALWAEQTVDDEKRDACLKLRYKLSPDFSNQAIQNIDVKFEGDQIRSFSKKVKGDTDTDLTMDKMEAFHDIINRYMYDTYGIDFENCVLTNICLPALSASSDGHIKVHQVNKIKTVLGFLTSISQEKFVSKENPGLGVPLNAM